MGQMHIRPLETRLGGGESGTAGVRSTGIGGSGVRTSSAGNRGSAQRGGAGQVLGVHHRGGHGLQPTDQVAIDIGGHQAAAGGLAADPFEVRINRVVPWRAEMLYEPAGRRPFDKRMAARASERSAQASACPSEGDVQDCILD